MQVFMQTWFRTLLTWCFLWAHRGRRTGCAYERVLPHSGRWQLDREGLTDLFNALRGGAPSLGFLPALRQNCGHQRTVCINTT